MPENISLSFVYFIMHLLLHCMLILVFLHRAQDNVHCSPPLTTLWGRLGREKNDLNPFSLDLVWYSEYYITFMWASIFLSSFSLISNITNPINNYPGGSHKCIMLITLSPHLFLPSTFHLIAWKDYWLFSATAIVPWTEDTSIHIRRVSFTEVHDCNSSAQSSYPLYTIQFP